MTSRLSCICSAPGTTAPQTPSTCVTAVKEALASVGEGLPTQVRWRSKLAEAQVLVQPGSVDLTGRREQSSVYVRDQVARVRTADPWMPRCGRRSPVALAEEVVDVPVGVCTTDELTKRVAKVRRLYAGTLASPLAGPDLGQVAPR
jgi:hypothetical protein